jgi:hypothetical protein
MQNKTPNSIKVMEINSGEVLFETDMNNSELAYQQATIFENMGIDVQVKMPGVTESLARELGVTDEQLRILEEILEQEILSHDDSCALKLVEQD